MFKRVLRARRVQRFLRNRYLSTASLIFTFVFLELVEFFLSENFGFEIHVLYGIVMFIVIIPLVFWGILDQLQEVEQSRERLARDVQLQYDFSRKLGDVGSQAAVYEQIVTFPGKVLQDVRSYLFIQGEHGLQQEVCHLGNKTLFQSDCPPSSSWPEVGDLDNRVSLKKTALNTIEGLLCSEYNLVFRHNGALLGVLHLEFPAERILSPHQIAFLDMIASEISLSLENVRLQKASRETAEANELDRRKIARDLHDMLAPNIGLLRLKLEALSDEDAVKSISSLSRELKLMSTVVNDAYNQVRQTIDHLKPVQEGSLTQKIYEYGQRVAARSGFKLTLEEVGQVKSIDYQIEKQLIFITREALNNIEKHSNASQVQITIKWMSDELLVDVKDNGIGFSLADLGEEGHYGLKIMQERAREAGGVLQIESQPGNGTEVLAWVVLSDRTAVAEGA